MAQRFAKELVRELPEVDAFIGLDQVADTGRIVEELLASTRSPTTNGIRSVLSRDAPVYIPDFDTPRFRLTPTHTAFTKIAEGCNHPCSFCVIPQMRGRHRSARSNRWWQEVRGLVAEGVKEINLISQDTTYFGMDLWEEKAGPRTRVDSARGPT
jgi:ribosomal protein S12 methylthiotransferase